MKRSQISLHDQYWVTERAPCSPYGGSECDLSLMQDGRYTKIPGRNLPDVEELAFPSRQLATTTRSRSSQGT